MTILILSLYTSGTTGKFYYPSPLFFNQVDWLLCLVIASTIPSVSCFDSGENIVIVAAYSLLVLSELGRLYPVSRDVILTLCRNFALLAIQSPRKLQKLGWWQSTTRSPHSSQHILLCLWNVWRTICVETKTDRWQWTGRSFPCCYFNHCTVAGQHLVFASDLMLMRLSKASYGNTMAKYISFLGFGYAKLRRPLVHKLYSMRS